MSYAPDGSPRFSPKAPLAPANTWNPLGQGLYDRVNAIAVEGPNVYVGGTFSGAGDNDDANYIAYWNYKQRHLECPRQWAE